MPSFTVNVKWGKENFKNIEVNTDEEPLLFKAQLFALTGVQPERQKVLCKGISLKDEEWNMPIKNGATLLLLGTKEEVPQEPVEKPKFIEDMNESELATALELPAGLVNLGNTCYMNATLQCLRSVRELRAALKEYREDSSSASGLAGLASPQAITMSMKNLFEDMERSDTITPVLFLQRLHIAFPNFAQTGESGSYRQQDANECWSELLKMLQQKLPAQKRSAELTAKHSSFIDQWFGGTFDVDMKCTEADDEPVSKSKENFLQLSCFISTEVKYMHSGLRLRLKEQLTKMSPSLGRDAVYSKTSLISRLPAYLTVQFVRFQYKGKEGINAKVLKDIKFPIDFDAFELCTPELQEKLTPMRTKFNDVQNAEVERTLKGKNKSKAELEKEKPKTVAQPYCFEDDLGSNNSGYYTLQAVLTHQGRSSSSGHYVSWVRQKDDQWIKFDDDHVSPVDTESILKLSGGGDWHCAYVLVYGPKILEIPVETESQAGGEEQKTDDQATSSEKMSTD
ncbi:ubiquitin carboxyl-terminal hydrolase 14 [Anopheles ziemanni]|uniref:ubiquitin carboxyl-terminal hydrolase 14 n=1 Tax=Anopheles coustani TaxID=139045 RepID=UPI00265A08C7|nr:ubiquitin carboxyl-terminal hydrolase 14 [Anopheles coustani]XP_058167883.1 ubiquitin carboxyl-terminal hydrolase 14 [Anopheles ziemanni]